MVQGTSGHLDSWLPDTPPTGAYVRGLTGPCELWTDDCRMEAMSAGEFTCSRLSEPQKKIAAYACRQASAMLWRRTGRLPQLSGRCVHTIRPCVESHCRCDVRYRLHRGEYSHALWRLSCGMCGSRQPAELLLPRKPVTAIVEVVINGYALNANAYAVTGYNRLIRLDGHAWPCIQDRNIRDASLLPTSPTTDQIASRANTWLVRYQIGTRIPDDAADIAAILALELYWARVDKGKCRVPINAGTVTKGGVTVTRGSGADDTILELIPEVKAWVRTINPNNLPSRPMAVSPARRRRREQIRTGDGPIGSGGSGTSSGVSGGSGTGA